MSGFKDGVPANTHPLNLVPGPEAPGEVSRIPLYEVYMRMAEELAKRSTCSRLQVGTVITDQTLENVLDKVVFVSASPCVMCAKLIINSGVTHLFYRKAYRDPTGVEVLQQGGVVPVLYDRWDQEWR